MARRATKDRLKHTAWWLASDEEMPGEIFKRSDYLHMQNRDMRLDNAMYLSIASNGNVDGSGSYGSETTQYRMLGLKMRKNLVQSLIDMGASLIASNRTMPMYLTTAGDYSLASKAEQKSRVLHSQMWGLSAFDLGVDAFYDAAKVGTGATYGYVDPVTGLPKLARAKPNSLLTDLAEGDNPRTMFWVHFLNKGYLLELHKDDQELCEKIERSQGPSIADYDDHWIREDNKADLVKVIEAWHLPSTKDSKDGWHVVATNQALLSKVEHTRQRFPFAFYNYAKRTAGFWGQGLVERALPSQIRHWQLQTVIDRCQDACTNSVYLIEENSNARMDDIDNGPGLGIYYSGTAPQQVTWSGTPQDLVAEQQRIWSDLLEQEGFSPGMVGGELPQKGLSSGRAVRAADDISSRRQVIPTRAFEGYYLQIAQLISDLNDDCAEDNDAYKVQGTTRTGRQSFLSSSRWKELAFDEGDVRLTVFSMSAQPTTPAAKMQAVSEYTQAGYMSKAQAISLLEFPDIEAWESLETANEDLVAEQIGQLRQGVPTLPIPNQDLTLAKQRVNDAFLVAYRMKAPQETLQCFLDYIAYADQKLKEIAPQQPTPGDQPTLDAGQAAAAQQATQALGAAA